MKETTHAAHATHRIRRARKTQEIKFQPYAVATRSNYYYRSRTLTSIMVGAETGVCVGLALMATLTGIAAFGYFVAADLTSANLAAVCIIITAVWLVGIVNVRINKAHRRRVISDRFSRLATCGIVSVVYGVAGILSAITLADLGSDNTYYYIGSYTNLIFWTLVSLVLCALIYIVVVRFQNKMTDYDSIFRSISKAR